MQLLLEREPSKNEWTLGRLSVDGSPECFICEDVVREIEGQPVATWKIPNKTAIPRGRYKVIVSLSPHFGRLLPLLLDVPGYEGVRIHSGNTAVDTEGCLLPGVTHDAKGVISSRVAFEALFSKLHAASDKHEEIWIEVK